MHVVEDQLQVVRRAYVPLALFSKDLAQRENDLSAYLEEQFSAEPSLQSAWTQLKTTRERRNQSLIALQKASLNLGEIAGADAKQFGLSIKQLASGAAMLDADYQAVYDAAQKSLPLDDLSFADAL